MVAQSLNAILAAVGVQGLTEYIKHRLIWQHVNKAIHQIDRETVAGSSAGASPNSIASIVTGKLSGTAGKASTGFTGGIPIPKAIFSEAAQALQVLGLSAKQAKEALFTLEDELRKTGRSLNNVVDVIGETSKSGYFGQYGGYKPAAGGAAAGAAAGAVTEAMHSAVHSAVVTAAKETTQPAAQVTAKAVAQTVAPAVAQATSTAVARVLPPATMSQLVGFLRGKLGGGSLPPGGPEHKALIALANAANFEAKAGTLPVSAVTGLRKPKPENASLEDLQAKLSKNLEEIAKGAQDGSKLIDHELRYLAATLGHNNVALKRVVDAFVPRAMPSGGTGGFAFGANLPPGLRVPFSPHNSPYAFNAVPPAPIPEKDRDTRGPFGSTRPAGGPHSDYSRYDASGFYKNAPAAPPKGPPDYNKYYQQSGPNSMPPGGLTGPNKALVAGLIALGPALAALSLGARLTNNVLNATTATFNGVAQAAVAMNALKTVFGPIADLVKLFDPAIFTQLQLAIGDTMAAFGEILLPIIAALIPIVRMLGDTLVTMKPAFDPVIAAITDMMGILAQLIVPIASILTPVLGILAYVLKEVIVPALQLVVDIFKKVGEVIKNFINFTIDLLNAAIGKINEMLNWWRSQKWLPGNPGTIPEIKRVNFDQLNPESSKGKRVLGTERMSAADYGAKVREAAFGQTYNWSQKQVEEQKITNANLDKLNNQLDELRTQAGKIADTMAVLMTQKANIDRLGLSPEGYLGGKKVNIDEELARLRKEFREIQDKIRSGGIK